MKALMALSNYLPPDELLQVLTDAQVLKNRWYRVTIVTALTIRLAELGKLQPDHVLAIAKIIEDKILYTAMLTFLNLYLPEQGFNQALTGTPSIKDTDITNVRTEGALITLCVRMIELGHYDRAFTLAIKINSERLRRLIFTAIAPFLPAAYVMKVFAYIRTMTTEHKVQVLVALAPYLPSGLIQQTLSIAQTIGSEERRVQLLITLALYLLDKERISLYEIWHNIMSILAKQPRRSLLRGLEALVPITSTLGGSESITDIRAAIQDIAKWWP